MTSISEKGSGSADIGSVVKGSFDDVLMEVKSEEKDWAHEKSDRDKTNENRIRDRLRLWGKNGFDLII